MGESRKAPHIDQDVTMTMFKKFADVEEVDESVAKHVMLSAEVFWEYLINSWEAYAAHAGRQHLEKSDIQLHMLRTGLANNSNEFSALVTSHLPPSLAIDVLEIAQCENKNKERRRRNTVNIKVVSPKSKDLERRRRHTIHVKSVSPKPEDLDTAVTSGGQVSSKRRLFSSFFKEKIILK